jgi:L-2-hydroxyglutarate oxidase LhgO
MVDIAIVGGGIVGLATAMGLLKRFPDVKLLVLEKEPQLGAHQTGHNSGVIHSGVYYRPGSLKAKTCVAGAKLLMDFCQSQGIPYEQCGKLVVATDASELSALDALYQRGLANGVAGLSVVGPEQMREFEPHARGVRALHVASTGIVDYTVVARAFAQIIQQRGGQIRTSACVRQLWRREGVWMLQTNGEDVRAKHLIVCGGLHADRLTTCAQMGGVSIFRLRLAMAKNRNVPNFDQVRIVPFRGEYYDLIPERRHLINAMVYPVPNPALPFLGVHFTRSINGTVHAGPNAVLALKREGYRKTDISLADVMALASHRGFWRMARRYWSVGLKELYRSWSKRAFVRVLQRLVPEIAAADLVPGGCGVRAQALDDRGTLLDDFDIIQREHAIHVRNVPSPAATASIRIGEIITDMAASAFF